MNFTPEIIQYAWVVPNLEMAIRNWHARTGIGPFLVNRDIALEHPLYRRAISTTRFSTAVAQHGEVQIELIEQLDDTPSIYRETVAPGTIGFHHVAFLSSDYDAALAHYMGLGHGIAASGRFGPMRYAYVDTLAHLGHMTEIVEDKPAIQAFFGAVRKAAERWDRDPATLIRELG